MSNTGTYAAEWNITRCDTLIQRTVNGHRAVCSCGWKSVPRRTRTLALGAGQEHIEGTF